jgi:hypothetical protein
MKRTTRFLTLALALVLGLGVLAGCSNDVSVTAPAQDEYPEGAPQLPPASTMRMELDFFGVDTPALDEASLQRGVPGSELQAATADDHTNWINAFVRAVFVQLLMYDALEEPIAAFALAAHSIPQLQDDGSYLWTYIFVEDSIEYSIFLYGTPMTDRVEWRLEVSTNHPDVQLDHFVWFDGVTMTDDSEGYWQFYEPVVAPTAAASASAEATDGVALIRIDWTNAPAGNTLRLTVNGEGHEDFGDYVEFFASATTGSIEHYDASEDLLSSIVWYADGSGSLTVPDYNDGLQACWDTGQRNVECD